MAEESNDDVLTIQLPTLANGAANELFEDELSKVLENILDVNTEAEATRSITLKLTVKPALDRDSAALKFEASSKLAPTLGVGTAMFIGKQDGRFIAVEHNPKQLQLDLDKARSPVQIAAAPTEGEQS